MQIVKTLAAVTLVITALPSFPDPFPIQIPSAHRDCILQYSDKLQLEPTDPIILSANRCPAYPGMLFDPTRIVINSGTESSRKFRYILSKEQLECLINGLQNGTYREITTEGQQILQVDC